MTTAVTAFVCDFCTRKKRFASKRGADQHERQCFHNPIRKACASCVHLIKERYDSEDGSGGNYCELEIVPIPATAEDPERRFIADCESWKGIEAPQ